jgi:transposase
MRRTGISKTAVWRWQERFMTDGVDGLLHDKTRPSRIAPLPAEVEQRVVALILIDSPDETIHWTAGAMAKENDISVSSVQRIWRRHGLQPHRTRQFKLSKDPQFATKLHEIVGLYVGSPDDLFKIARYAAWDRNAAGTSRIGRKPLMALLSAQT